MAKSSAHLRYSRKPPSSKYVKSLDSNRKQQVLDWIGHWLGEESPRYCITTKTYKDGTFTETIRP